MRILLTGSAGFVGSHLTERLLADGHIVIGVDNYISGQPSNTALFEVHPNFKFIQADVSDGIPYKAATFDGQKLDYVLHFASPASPPHYQQFPIETLMVGAQGTQHALELAHAHGAPFLLASTSEVYGDPQVHPQTEDYWGHVNPNGLRSCYDEAKRYAEAITFAYHRHHGVDTRVIRIFNTYGPRMRPDDGRVVTNLIVQALAGQPLTVYGDGQQTRSFQYVTDLVDGIVALMSIKESEDVHAPVNLGNPDEYTILQFAQVIRELIDPTLEIIHEPLPADDPRQRRPDISRARELLGWAPGVDLHTGLMRTVESFRASRSAAPVSAERTPVAAE
ncbi:UDP-glucuronic acid decarboxylase family protein [Deinococcus humi]|uniref:dTDP-glucose 4,6-dehydratase n=1 Tax=Deinococcus humi TaxID=662880 RepID=A0A7W8NH79_9DEIO|nr:UDP-glucuronic acid decarboxylase family protein [Deinococcus humi]MBB5366271.1 dTDP-glucose 4,6-dehydratase [Deinococcus humi]GGO41949.1 epimerase [Deinococcus humi]